MGFFDRLRALFGGPSDGGVAGGNGAGSADSGDIEMISCHEALVMVHEYLDGELDDVPEAQVKAHFDVCQACYPHLHLERVCRDALRRAAATEVAPPELKERIARMISEAESES